MLTLEPKCKASPNDPPPPPKKKKTQTNLNLPWLSFLFKLLHSLLNSLLQVVPPQTNTIAWAKSWHVILNNVLKEPQCLCSFG